MLRKDLQILKKDLQVFMKESILASEDRMTRYFDVKTEQIIHDFRGAFGDRTEQHQDQLKDHDRRLVRVERHLGFAA